MNFYIFLNTIYTQFFFKIKKNNQAYISGIFICAVIPLIIDKGKKKKY